MRPKALAVERMLYCPSKKRAGAGPLPHPLEGQYSSGNRIVVALLSASVMTQIFWPEDRW
jgi:hypothetical protein